MPILERKTIIELTEELETDKNPQLKIYVPLPETAKDVKYKVDIIRNGEVIHRFESTGNTEMTYEDKYVKLGEKFITDWISTDLRASSQIQYL